MPLSQNTETLSAAGNDEPASKDKAGVSQPVPRYGAYLM